MARCRLFLVFLALAVGTLALPGLSASAQPSSPVPRSGVVEVGPSARRPAVPRPSAAPGAPAAISLTNVDASNDPAPQNETTVATNPLNVRNIVGGANDYRCTLTGDAGAGFYTSMDGGATWSGGLLPGITPCGGGSYQAAGDPALAVDAAGSFYYAAIDFDRTTSRSAISVSKSTDGGLTWGSPTFVTATNNSQIFNDKDYIAVDTHSASPFFGRVYVSWTRFNGNLSPIVVSSSTDGGATFGPFVTASGAVNDAQGSVPAVGPNGELYVAFWSQSGAIYVVKSTNGGASFAAPVKVANIVTLPSPLPGNSFRVNSFPSIAVGPNGNVYVSWSEWVNGTNADVRFSRSTNGGVAWSAPVRVNSNPSDDQFFNWIAVAPNGTIGICFYDQSFNSLNWLDVGCNKSTNGGLSWGTTIRVTSTSSNPANDGFGGGFIGDYTGLALTVAGKPYPIWTDTRTGNADVFTLRW